MKAVQKYTLSAVGAAMPVVLGGCTGMSPQDGNTAIGAGVGAAIGGVTGHEIDD
ncbi:osmotically-inducible lipoprotein B [Sedimenticola hydrogenitrophicus]|uniref:osmotically-inducible lipoprotein B n=1 Tax=Sedimenticola hydrogenitrophicus TaxID=2967975 RepID=UPI0021A89B87|nr:osmotically-inducible lipoprotein B [Sedimenticola hydrogenitrophicus]